MCIEQTIVATLARSHSSFTVEAKPTAFFNVDVAVVSFFSVNPAILLLSASACDKRKTAIIIIYVTRFTNESSSDVANL